MSHFVLELRQSNYQVFLEVYEMLHRKVYHFFLKRTKNPEEAEELTQDCFVKLWLYRTSLSTAFTLEKQVFTISFGLLINHHKKEKGLREKRNSFIQMLPAEPSVFQDGFEIEDQLLQALNKLPPVGRKVASLKIIKGYSNKEIAEELSVSTKTVEGHVTKAFRVIKENLHLLFIYFPF